MAIEPTRPATKIDETDEDFNFIREIVYRHSRISLGPHKKPMVLSRIASRIRLLNLEDLHEYCNYLRSGKGKAEFSSLIDVISTNHTYFFRETSHFDYLSREILRHERGVRQEPFRVWSAACSSGEEPYCVAMLLAEQRRINRHFDWRIEAHDISTTILDRARRATYPLSAIERVPQVLKDRYLRFKQDSETVSVSQELKKKITFARMNLLEMPAGFLGEFDLILCRNVMIYFDRETRQELVQTLSRRLSRTGTLFVGHSESLGGLRHDLSMVRPAIYRKGARING